MLGRVPLIDPGIPMGGYPHPIPTLPHPGYPVSHPALWSTAPLSSSAPGNSRPSVDSPKAFDTRQSFRDDPVTFGRSGVSVDRDRDSPDSTDTGRDQEQGHGHHSYSPELREDPESPPRAEKRSSPGSDSPGSPSKSYPEYCKTIVVKGGLVSTVG